MKKNLSVAAAIGTLIMILVMRWQGAALNSHQLVRKEFWTLNLRIQKTDLHEVLLHWDLVGCVKMNIWLDFLFIVCYVLISCR